MTIKEVEQLPERTEEQVEAALREMGLYRYREFEVVDRFYDIYGAVLDGVRVKPDGPAPRSLPGLVNTGIDLISPEAWKKAPPGKALACAFGGTEWKVGKVAKLKTGEVTWEEVWTKTMSGEDRKLSSYDLARLMAEEINKAAVDSGVAVEEIDALAIALGFAQKNRRVPRGIEAQLTRHANSKGWKFLDPDPDARPGLGDLVLTELKVINPAWRASCFAFRNDTHGVAEDGQTFEEFMLALGFVFGTGDNGAVGPINLELGKMPIEADPILEKMVKMGLLPDPAFIQEYLMGGNYIRFRVAAAVELLGTENLFSQFQETVRALLETKNKAIMSELARAKTADEIRKVLGVEMDNADAARVQLASEIALAQAGQIMAMNMMAVVMAAGYPTNQKAGIAVEGSVFWKGYQVRETAQRTMEQISPGNKLYFKEAIGMRGVGEVALAQRADARS